MKKDTNQEQTMSLKALIFLGLATFVVIRLALKSIAWMAVKIVNAVELMAPKRVADDKALRSIKAAKANIATHRDFDATTLLSEPLAEERFIPADRIVSIRLDPPVAVLNLRLYMKQKLIKRDMLITEPRLRTLMRGRHHSLGDIPFEDISKLESIKDEAVQKAEEVINRVGSKGAENAGLKPAKSITQAPQPKQQQVQAKVIPDKSPPVEAKPLPEVKALPVQKEQAAPMGAEKPRNFYVPKVTEGVTYKGKLIRAGSKTFTPEGRKPYESFEAVLQLDNGSNLPLRGAELERELLSHKVQIGEYVAITPQGAVPVQLPDDKIGRKNLYSVSRLEGALN
jgi:hypothetical protein